LPRPGLRGRSKRDRVPPTRLVSIISFFPPPVRVAHP
jgi:hypothetical protein